MYPLIRSLLFQMEPEKAHHLTLTLLAKLPARFFPKIDPSPITAMGLNFAHSVGLAAGFDKNGEYVQGLKNLGFAFIEVGTVTPKPQMGNPKPRLFRLASAKALINRMGFNNDGVEKLVQNIKKTDVFFPLGINIGKNKDTSLQNAAEDYLFCLRKTYEQASYITINISSPNTPELRLLQQKDFLFDLLQKLGDEQKRLADKHQRHVPLVVKLSPDEKDDELKKMVDVIMAHGIEGVIATNTTCSRKGVEGFLRSQEQGGLSGRPLFDRATECLRIIRQTAGPELCIIAAGGIDSLETAIAKREAGATLLQIYTGLIYQGPAIIAKIVHGLGKHNEEIG